MFIKQHLDHFENCDFIDQGIIGSDVLKWWNYVLKESTILQSERLSRERLKQICHVDSGYNEKEVIASIMAWGGQNRKHGQTLFKRYDEVAPVVRAMRTSEIDHFTAYELLDALWKKKGASLGMGAAYFTKLIFFCHPDHKGYIMDQWTSKSINLLIGSEVVHLSKQGYVTKYNDVSHYKQFCYFVDAIANKLNVSGETIENRLFSKGGRNKGEWRKYICNNWQYHT